MVDFKQRKIVMTATAVGMPPLLFIGLLVTERIYAWIAISVVVGILRFMTYSVAYKSMFRGVELQRGEAMLLTCALMELFPLGIWSFILPFSLSNSSDVIMSIPIGWTFGTVIILIFHAQFVRLAKWMKNFGTGRSNSNNKNSFY